MNALRVIARLVVKPIHRLLSFRPWHKMQTSLQKAHTLDPSFRSPVFTKCCRVVRIILDFDCENHFVISSLQSILRHPVLPFWHVRTLLNAVLSKPTSSYWHPLHPNVLFTARQAAKGRSLMRRVRPGESAKLWSHTLVYGFLYHQNPIKFIIIDIYQFFFIAPCGHQHCGFKWY